AKIFCTSSSASGSPWRRESSRNASEQSTARSSHNAKVHGHRQCFRRSRYSHDMAPADVASPDHGRETTTIDAITILFTDIVDSSGHWDADADAMRLALSEHDEILRREIAAASGDFVKHTGDGVMATFTSVEGAIRAAVA